MRRWMLIASMLFCRVALSEEPAPAPKEPASAAKEPAPAAKEEAAPPAELPFKLLAAVRPVSLETVDQVVEASDRAVQSCNKNVHRADTLAILMHITINADGKVSAVEAVPSDSDAGKAPAEAACLARVAKKLKFPATGTVSHVHYPFMLVSTARRAPN